MSKKKIKDILIAEQDDKDFDDFFDNRSEKDVERRLKQKAEDPSVSLNNFGKWVDLENKVGTKDE